MLLATRINQSSFARPTSSGGNTDPSSTLKQTCACFCSGWAEIVIRRPTGNMSWVMRIQNQTAIDLQTYESLHDIIALFLPSLTGVMGTDFLNSSMGSSSAALSPTRKLSAASRDVSATPNTSKLLDDELNDHLSPLTAGSSTASGPINIPKAPLTKESAGSFSDVDPVDAEVSKADGLGGDGNCDDDDDNDEDESRSRNPVRRVNSSPEMSSNWRNPHSNQKGGCVSVGSTGGGSILSTDSHHHDTDVSVEIELQQKKKNFVKDMRVSCEAIPEEIAGSTPPSQPESLNGGSNSIAFQILQETNDSVVGPTMVGAVIATAASTTEITARSSVLSPFSSFPFEATQSTSPITAQHTIAPKKQLSADDAVQVASDPLSLTLPADLSGSQNLKLKIPSMDMAKVTTKPPHSPAPLSPRLLAKNAANKIASISPSISATGGNDGYYMSRGRSRSKTISVVPKHESRDNASAANWAFKASKCTFFVFLFICHGENLKAARKKKRQRKK